MVSDLEESTYMTANELDSDSFESYLDSDIKLPAATGSKREFENSSSLTSIDWELADDLLRDTRQGVTRLATPAQAPAPESMPVPKWAWTSSWTGDSPPCVFPNEGPESIIIPEGLDQSIEDEQLYKDDENWEELRDELISDGGLQLEAKLRTRRSDILRLRHRRRQDVLAFNAAQVIPDLEPLQKSAQKAPFRGSAPRKIALENTQGIITSPAYISTPIRRVPDDILGEIFAALSFKAPNRVGTPDGLLVTQVCSHWRNVALNNPRVWSSFVFRLNGKEDSHRHLELTLERCKAAPLFVAVVNDLTETDDIANARRKIALLAQHAESIVHLRFQGTGQYMLPAQFPEFAAFRGRFLRLQLLEFTYFWRVFGDIFSGAPRLRFLEVSSSSDVMEMKTVIPQLEGIRCATSTSGYHLRLAQSLDSLPVRVAIEPPALQRLKNWRIEFPQPRPTDDLDVIIAQSLHLPDTVSNFFSRFRTPALRTLHIVRLTSVEGLINLCMHSGCEVTALVLQESSITAQEFIKLLAAMPGLEKLAIIAGNEDLLGDDVVRALRLCSETTLIPCLTDLWIDGRYKLSTNSLLNLLADRAVRQSHNVALRKVDVRLRDRVVGEDEVEFLRGLKEDWDVSFTGEKK
ncbi:hypothetical protein R3P38DRAFT_2843725 [Favolaschia claudopus]|uniref:F-box domain-containing protein n=1 Tax=Favolaschia claudopus TaxID=2862362 RepID=A0AAW0E229_9AGAR